MNVTIRHVYASNVNRENSQFVADVRRHDIVEPCANNLIGHIISDIAEPNHQDVRRHRTGVIDGKHRNDE